MIATAPRPTPADFLDSLQPLAAELGPDAVLALVREFGGTRLYVPLQAPTEGPLLALGQAAAPLCALFGGTRIEVPLTAFRREAHARWIASLKAKGHTINAIARALGVSYRFVQEVSAGAPVKPPRGRVVDARQLSLLDR